MKENIYPHSRRMTPWTDKVSATALDVFLDNHASAEYSHRRHFRISNTKESELLNTFKPEKSNIAGINHLLSMELDTGLCRYIQRHQKDLYDSDKAPVCFSISSLYSTIPRFSEDIEMPTL